MTRIKAFCSAQAGALLLETALVTPILLLLFISVAQFGFAFYVQATLQSAVRSAARDASIDEATVTNVSPATTPAPTACTAAVAGTVEEVVCGYLNNTDLFAGQANFSVLAVEDTYDNETAGNAADDVANMIQVTAFVPLNQVVFLDYNGFLSGGRNLSAYAIMQREP